MSSRPPAAAERGPSANGRRGGALTPAPAAALPQRPYPPPLFIPAATSAATAAVERCSRSSQDALPGPAEADSRRASQSGPLGIGAQVVGVAAAATSHRGVLSMV